MVFPERWVDIGYKHCGSATGYILDPSYSKNYRLHKAAIEGNADLVKSLIESGANPNHRSKNGFPCLIQAAEAGHLDAIEKLLDGGAEINATDNIQGMTALHAASFAGYDKIVQLLIKRGADITRKNNKDLTPLDLATNSQTSTRDSVISILRNGAKENQ